ncbi:hypothetical protein C7H19_08195 [Aphanothece hegewaldii CCALA 016]|uniref:Transcriptional regulator n=1 Tax=Aphanothece hegewaldii CCALA 016 TaxID=2107694 RepID=A0A2T1LZU5_9CHRO|nr:response regulator [Aphanothece hegewaldii]PSF37944.1 hypothetical protein C7H19_08195 [Aphanothece hegewaldii CCALA 016]
MRLLLVEDDQLLAQKLVTDLIRQHYVVDVASDGEMGWNYAQSVTYDLILLEVSLPKRDGITLCRQLRAKNYHGPILLLTAHQNNGTKVHGLDAGADDYILTPYHPDELFAQIRALLRRRDIYNTSVLSWGDLCLDPSTCQLSFKDQYISLSAKEYSLIELFMRHPRRIFSSNVILDHLWSFDNVPNKDTVRAHIKRLRKKLKDVGAQNYIETVYGIGYRLKVPETKTNFSLDAEPISFTVTQEWERQNTPLLERVMFTSNLLLQSTVEVAQEQAQEAFHPLAEFPSLFGTNSLHQRDREIFHTWTECSLFKPSLRFKAHNSSNCSFSHQLLLISQDYIFAESLQTLSKKAKIQINTVFTLKEVQEQIKQRSRRDPQSGAPHLILLDLSSVAQVTDGLIFLEELTTRYPHLPILVFTVDEELLTRLEIARRGGKRLISKYLPSQQLLALIQKTLSSISLDNIKVLAVDDDPLLLEALQQLLPSWGIELTTLNDPRQFWETLIYTVPDILLLNVDMPHITGIELCQVVRNDNQWDNLPILFLTSRHEKDVIHSLFSAGADDYVNKPFCESELITRIFNRLKRNRVLKNTH